MAEVWIPSLLQRLTDGEAKVKVQGRNLREVIDNLDARHPGMKARLLDEHGNFMEGVAIAIDGEISHMGLIEPLAEASEVHIIPAIGGGGEHSGSSGI